MPQERGNLSIFGAHKKDKNNNFEFYTPVEKVEKLLPFLPKDGKYMECFDRGGQSAFYTVLKSNGFDVKILGSYNCELFQEYEQLVLNDEVEKRSIVTNPPFVSKEKFYSRMAAISNGKMWAVMPDLSFRGMTSYHQKKLAEGKDILAWHDDYTITKRVDIQKWDLPDGSQTRSPHGVLAEFIRKSDVQIQPDLFSK